MRAAALWWARGVRQLIQPFEARRCNCRTRHSPPPNLRTHVTPPVLAYWRELGWTVHVVGQAVYAHSGNHHLLVLESRYPVDVDDEQAWRRLARDARGRFVGVMPWWSWPQPVLYRWDGQ